MLTAISVDTRTVFLAGLNSPFGMTLVGSDLCRYHRCSDAFPVSGRRNADHRTRRHGGGSAGGPAQPSLTKNVIASRDGSRLYVTVGSNSNVAKMDWKPRSIARLSWRWSLRPGAPRVFASGLRNPNGLAWQPQSGALWTVVNERDDR